MARLETCIAVLAVLLLPMVLRGFVEMLQPPADVSLWLHLRDSVRAMGRYLVQALCMLTFLPDEAYYSLDAVVRTLLRLTITKRNLLQWQTSIDEPQGAVGTTYPARCGACGLRPSWPRC